MDGFGGVADAVSLAADRAGIAEDFRVYEILSEPDSFALFLSMLSARTEGFASTRIRGRWDEAFVRYDVLRRTLEQEGIMALMPYMITFE